MSSVRSNRASSRLPYTAQAPFDPCLRSPLGPSSFRHVRTFNFEIRRKLSAAASVDTSDPPIDYQNHGPVVSGGIRGQLQEWQTHHADDELQYNPIKFEADVDDEASLNDLSRLPDSDPWTTARQSYSMDDQNSDDAALNGFTGSHLDDFDDASTSQRFLRMGDLVELKPPSSERDSTLAVFVRRAGQLSQFFTMHGKWTHWSEKSVPYCVPEWVSPSLVEPLLPHLPDVTKVDDVESLLTNSYLNDLSVPRAVAAPLVARLRRFHAKSQEVYRQHANRLDHAHDILAHDSDLRYGSLVSAASTLLAIPPSDISTTALWATRNAMSRAGFGFRFDPLSQRLTGYMQILSKEHVRSIELVRGWFRQWQDDIAKVATMDDRQRSRHRPSQHAQIFHNFIEKAKRMVLESRKDREPDPLGNIGISRKRFAITPQQPCIQVIAQSDEFTAEETEIVKFLEAWACQLLKPTPRLMSLPCLILQQTGLYKEHYLGPPTGYLFLQEIGTFTPYENRVHFNPSLLLPSSQHSRPLQNLMVSIMGMADNHGFQDAMVDLRHDWGDLPVYCIDDATAEEIDDGISIESAGVGPDGEELSWVHVHVANPTAFFSRNHPIAKMARHMGETIYLPERTYPMLPSWASSKHFSLGNNRPCLTFSSKVDRNGVVLDRKIRSGIVRNVLHISPEEVAQILGHSDRRQKSSIVLTVGGDPPQTRRRASQVHRLTAEMIRQLHSIEDVARQRAALRRSQGALNFLMNDQRDVSVWQSWGRRGLRWEHPWRHGARHLAGDPIIQLRTGPAPELLLVEDDDHDEVLVREMMLLACETGAAWCADRHIPFIFRGTVRLPGKMNADEYLRTVLEPAAKKHPSGKWPLHLTHEYITGLGVTALSTRPRRHRILALEHYGKVTSPLRRYGDMIAHWQIEAALREEARLGHSLASDVTPHLDPSFLPFNAEALNSIIVGMQPREKLISHCKRHATSYWHHLLLHRAVYSGECTLPFPVARIGADDVAARHHLHRGAKTALASNERFVLTFRVAYPSLSKEHRSGGVVAELNINARMASPHVAGLGNVEIGDLWEAHIECVSVYHQEMLTWPVKLLERNGVRLG